jgi:hypothetical protein
VRILLDECVDWRLSRSIVGHDVKNARQMGWAAVENGQLLSLASGTFDVFVTADRNLEFQQNIRGLRLAIIVLYAKINRLADLLPLVPKLLMAIDSAKPGLLAVVGDDIQA